MDYMHRRTNKDFRNGISCGDGWAAKGYGHNKKRNQGIKAMRRKARRKGKQDLNNSLQEGVDMED